MEITHLPRAVGFIVADERTAVERDLVIGFIGKLMAKGRRTVSFHPLDALPAIEQQAAEVPFTIARCVRYPGTGFKIGELSARIPWSGSSNPYQSHFQILYEKEGCLRPPKCFCVGYFHTRIGFIDVLFKPQVRLRSWHSCKYQPRGQYWP